MNVTTAIQHRKSVRAYLDTPVETSQLLDIAHKAHRAPSGGNVQPWKIFILNETPMARFKKIMEERLAGTPHTEGETPEYQVYPPKLKEPYRTARFEVGEDMYGLLEIGRDDKIARRKWFANNYQFFGAPAGIFCFVDRVMGPPQFSDLGMYLQSFMLLCEEAGLSTCAQECWSMYPKTVGDFCNAPEELMLFCGMAIGHEDKNHPVNRLSTSRLPEDDWLTVLT